MKKAQSQILNKNKSSIFSSSNIKERDNDLLMQVISGMICGNYKKYLGLSVLVEKMD